jgi:hypothetical protein
MPVLTPKVIIYTVGPLGYKYPLCTSSTSSLYSLTEYTLLATRVTPPGGLH